MEEEDTGVIVAELEDREGSGEEVCAGTERTEERKGERLGEEDTEEVCTEEVCSDEAIAEELEEEDAE